MKNQYFLNNLLLLVFFSTYIFSKPYKGGELRTEDSFRYGRFEVRMKSAFGDGVVSSFFTYRDFWEEGLTSNSNWNEIDFEWLGNYDDKVQTNLIIQNTWDLPELVDLNVNPHEDFHTYAIEWTPVNVNFFIDDQLIRTVTNFYTDSLYHYQKLMMNIWQPTYEDWVGEFDPSILPVYAFYDWVKYYAYVPNSGNAGTNNDFILFWTDDFDYYDASRWDKANHTWDGNNCDLIYSNVVFEYGYLILCLTNSTETGYNGDPLSVHSNPLPKTISIGAPFPNPFNNSVVFPIHGTESSFAEYAIYDILGNKIRSENSLVIDRGTSNIYWNGTGKNGEEVSSGTYFFQVKNKDCNEIRKVSFLK